MVDERMDALAERQHGLITHEQATGLGLTESAIRHRRTSGALLVVHPRVYRMAGAPVTVHLRAHAAVLAAGRLALLSHSSAAGLHRLPGFAIEPLVVTTVRRWGRPLEEVRVEQSLALGTHHATVVDGTPCTTVARTLFDLCGDLHPRRAERAVDTALARRVVTLPALWRMLDELAERGRAGTVLMRELLTERGPRYVPPESELEARFIDLARRFGLPAPERQVDLGDSDSWIGRVDFVFRCARLVVEVDGAAFHDGLVDQRRDEVRDRRLRATGWTVLRLRWADVVDRPAVVADIIRNRCAIALP
jgi:hypothetical protein